MDLLTKEKILAADDIKRERVDVPEWGGAVLVGVLSGTDRDRWERECLEAREGTKNGGLATLDNFRASLAARSIVNEKGERLFAESDIVALGKKSGAALNRIFDVALKLNRLSASDVEELAKN
jgi:hypothetical protein